MSCVFNSALSRIWLIWTAVMERDEYRNMLYGAIKKFAPTRLASMY